MSTSTDADASHYNGGDSNDDPVNKKTAQSTDAADDEDGSLDGPILYVPPAAVSFLVKVTLLAAPPSPLGPAATATY